MLKGSKCSKDDDTDNLLDAVANPAPQGAKDELVAQQKLIQKLLYLQLRSTIESSRHLRESWWVKIGQK